MTVGRIKASVDMSLSATIDDDMDDVSFVRRLVEKMQEVGEKQEYTLTMVLPDSTMVKHTVIAKDIHEALKRWLNFQEQYLAKSRIG